MITLYETVGCGSCRKVKEWLDENNLDFHVVNIVVQPPTAIQLKKLFSLANDIYDIVSKRSNSVRNFRRTHGFDLEDLSFNDLIEFLHSNPTAMKRPLVTNGKFLISGYDADELTALLPREKRQAMWTAQLNLH